MPGATDPARPGTTSPDRLSEADRRTAVAAVVVVLLVLAGLAAWVRAGDVGRPPQAPVAGSAPLPVSGAPTSSAAATPRTGRSAQGSGGNARPTGASRLSPSVSPSPQAAVRWSAVAYPLDCQGVGVQVRSVVRGAVTDGRPGSSPDTVVQVTCAAQGSPASALYLYATDAPASGGGSGPRLLATLLTADDDELVTTVSVQDGAVVAAGTGYSGPAVPRCCPDRTVHLTWRWDGTTFRRSG